jgi:hypothetical protein
VKRIISRAKNGGRRSSVPNSQQVSTVFLETLEGTIKLTVELLERGKLGTGPENPESVGRLLEEKKQYLSESLRMLKENAKWGEEKRGHLSRLEELVEKFDISSLREAQDIVCYLSQPR